MILENAIVGRVPIKMMRMLRNGGDIRYNRLVVVRYRGRIIFTRAVPSIPLLVRVGVSDLPAALAGINAAVVGLLLAVLYQPIWTSAIHSPHESGLALIAFSLLVFWKWQPWIVVLLSGIGGAALVALR